MEKDLWGNEIKESEPKLRSKYLLFKKENDYKKAWDKFNCGNCKHSIHYEYHDKWYWKCSLMGVSHSTATDIRKSYVCDKWGI
jgi:hypothetical protein